MRKIHGLTLIELLVTLSLLSIIIITSAYSYARFLGHHLLTIRVHDIQRVIKYAKLTTLESGRSHILKPCSSTDWSHCIGLYDGGELKRRWQWGKSMLSVSWTGLTSNQFLNFSPQIENNMLNGHFIIQSPHQTESIYINRLGRTRTQRSITKL